MDIPQKENQKNKMNNQPPENNMPKNDSEKTENVFQSAKKSRISNWTSWTILGVVVLVVAGAIWWNWGGNKEVDVKTNLGQFKVCQQNSDCVAVPDGCCGCGGGGKNIAINKKFEEEYSKKIQNECNNTGCISVISNDPSCSGIPVCDENKCDLAVPTDDSNISTLCGPEPPATCSANTRLTCLNGKWECGTEEKVDTSSWTTYSNQKIKFKYPKEWTFNSENIFKDSNGNTIMSLSSASTDVLGISFCEANSDNSRCESIKAIINAPIIIDWQSDNQAVGEDYTTQVEKVFITLHIINNKTKQIFRTIMSTVNIP